MKNEMEREVRNSRNRFELEGNVANINDVYTTSNGKQLLRFDLAQNNNGTTQYVPIILRGELVKTYGAVIQKGDWITVKGRIATYSKDIEKDGKTFKEKTIDILGFEITDRKNNKVYTSSNQNKENTVTEMER